jgi:hypothetical protein
LHISSISSVNENNRGGKVVELELPNARSARAGMSEGDGREKEGRREGEGREGEGREKGGEGGWGEERVVERGAEGRSRGESRRIEESRGGSGEVEQTRRIPGSSLFFFFF